MVKFHETTTQFRHWHFSPDVLERIKENAHDEACRRIRGQVKDRSTLALDISNDSLDLNVNAVGKRSFDAEDIKEVHPLLTWREQDIYTRFLEWKIADYCRFFKFPLEVKFASIQFFKRFFLKHSVMEYDAKEMLIACLYFAAKLEFHPRLNADEFLAKIPKAPTNLIDLELMLVEGLDYQFQLHHSFTACHGIFLDVQQFIISSYPSFRHTTLIKCCFDVYTSSIELATASLFTDLIFTAMPSQIAFASFIGACRKGSSTDDKAEAKVEQLFDAYIDARFAEGATSTLADWRAKIDAILKQILIAHENPPIKEEAATVAKKLDHCFVPVLSTSKVDEAHVPFRTED